LVKNIVDRVDGVEVAVAGASLRGSALRAKDGAHWSHLAADLSLPVRSDPSRSGRVHLMLLPAKSGSSLAVSTPDAGALLAAYGRETLRGGTVRIAATVGSQGLSGPITGRFQAKSFTVVGMPWLVRLTTLASIDGLTSALTGSGVSFTEATADISLHGALLTIKAGVAEGPTMTVGMDGTIDTSQGTIEAKGSLLPIAFDRLMAKIPLLGTLMGHAARSVFEGVDFSLSGPISDPHVSVHPLSSLAPGALKSILRAVRE
jgi:hypothetical protein